MATDSQQKLMQTLNFTEADLTANRDGYLSERQKAYWRQRRKLTTIAFRLGQIVVVLLLAGLVQLAAQKNGIIWLAFIVGLMGLAVLWALGDLLNPATDYQEDLRKGHVYSICGDMKRTSLSKGYARYPHDYYHKMQIETVEFSANGYRWSAFQNGKSYCIYYMPDSKIILSAEAID
ncbi:MAG: hypothetical protein ABI690_00455 [Chloroflexota bacterium]